MKENDISTVACEPFRYSSNYLVVNYLSDEFKSFLEIDMNNNSDDVIAVTCIHSAYRTILL